MVHTEDVLRIAMTNVVWNRGFNTLFVRKPSCINSISFDFIMGSDRNSSCNFPHATSAGNRSQVTSHINDRRAAGS